MRHKKWDTFKVPCAAINTILSPPRGCTDLNKKEVAQLKKIQAKDELLPDDIEKLKVFDEKREKFINPPLSEGAKKYLIGSYGYMKYNTKSARTSISNKPCVAKGVALEEQGIELVSMVDKKNYQRPTGYIENDYIIGVCDAICLDDKHILEIKTSWNAANFMGVRRTNKLSNAHWAQMQGYLNLYNLDHGTVCFVLANTPPHLVELERASLFNKYLLGEVDREKYEIQTAKLDGIFNFEKIPAKKRIIRFDVKKSEEYIAKVIHRVGLCRDYLTQFDQIFTKNKNIITLAEDYLNASTEEDTTEYNPAESL